MIQRDLPIYSVFMLLIIVSTNYLGELMPCNVRNLMASSVFLKHIFAVLTMIFFVMLTDPDRNVTFNQIVHDSLILYLIFLGLIHCNALFFMVAVVLLFIGYVLHIKRREIIDDLYHEEIKEDEERDDALVDKASRKLRALTKMNTITNYTVFGVIVIGCLIFMGEQKMRHKGKFSYLAFIFGEPECIGKKYTSTNYAEAIRTALT